MLYLLNIIHSSLSGFYEREYTINNSLNAARDLEKKKDEALLQMNRELKDALTRRGKYSKQCAFRASKAEGAS